MTRDLSAQRTDEALEVVLTALKVPDINLEPTEEEVDSFLADEATERQQRGLVIGAEDAEMIAEVGAMNRLNASGEFQAETEARLEKKRALLLRWMIETHEGTDA